jgi:membrane-associated phospholipid phosphatase
MVQEKKQDTLAGKGFVAMWWAVGLLAGAAIAAAFLLDERVFQYLFQYHTDWYKNWYVVPVAMLGKGWLLVWLLTGWYVAGGRLRVTRAGLMSLLLVACIVVPVKAGVGRVRPGKAMDKISQGQAVEHRHSTNSSFPSGDTAAAFAAATVVAIFAGRMWGAGAMVIAGCVAFLRVVAMAHYPSDVFAGAAVGVLCGCTGVRIEQRWVPDDFPAAPRLRLMAVAFLVVLPAISLQRAGASWIWVFLCFYVPLMGVVWLYMRAKSRGNADS